MKKGILIVLFLNSCLLFAQVIESSKEIAYSISEPFDGLSSFQSSPLGFKKSFVLNGEINSFQISDGKFKFIKHSGPGLNETQRIEFPKDQKAAIEGIEQLGNRFYFFYSRWDLSKKSEQLFVRELDFEKNDFGGPEKLLHASDGKLVSVDYPLVAMMAFPKFKRSKSFDDNRLLVTYTWALKGKDKKTKNLHIGMHAYDDSMTEKWQRIVEIPFLPKQVAIYDYTIDRHYNAHVLVKIIRNESDEIKSKVGSHMLVFHVNAITGEVTETDVSVDSMYVQSAIITENENGQIIICGLYGDSGIRLTDGLFATTLHENGGIYLSQKVDIPTSLIAKYNSEGKQKKIESTAETSNWGLRDMVLTDVLINSDDAITLFAERRSVGHDITVSDRRGVQERSNVRYGDVLIAHLDSDSSLSWVNSIPKEQTVNVHGWAEDYLRRVPFGDLGYAVMNINNNPIVLFVDNDKNFNLQENEKPHVHRSGLGGFLTGYKIDLQKRTMENITFFDLKNAHGQILKNFSVNKVYQLSENEIAIEIATEVANKSVMVKINIQE